MVFSPHANVWVTSNLFYIGSDRERERDEWKKEREELKVDRARVERERWEERRRYIVLR